MGQPSLHHGPQGSVEKAGSLQVPDFLTSPPRFYSFEHFIKTPKPNHYFHLFDCASVWWGLFLSVAFKFSSFLGWEGREERGNHPSPLSCLPLWCSLKGNSWEHTQALGMRAAMLTHLPLNTCWRSPLIRTALRTGKSSVPPASRVRTNRTGTPGRASLAGG